MSKNPIGRQPGYVVSESTRTMIGDARRGHICPHRKAVIILGVKYTHLKQAALSLNLPVGTVRSRIRSETDMWKEWQYE